ncbi:biotin/lipoyl-binding protein [Candidatus Falkowbacteria bacterium]|nr:biotin/lipoyl-binding protein [Candidatus Falkowbacteria bacterium]
MTEKIITYLKSHKKKLVLSILLLGGGYYWYQSSQTKSVPTQYVLGKAFRGDLVVSITGTGQVEALSQIDIKPKSTANVVAVLAKEKQAVKAGDAIMQLDNKELKNQASQAKNSVDSARASLNLKIAGPTREDLAVSQKSVDSAKLSYDSAKTSFEYTKQTAEQALKKAQQQYDSAKVQYQNSLSGQPVTDNSNSQALENAYDNAKNSVSSAMLSLRSALVSADSVLGIDRTATFPDKTLLGVMNSQTMSDSQTSYLVAKESLAALDARYQSVSISWNRAQEEELLDMTMDTLQKMKILEHNVYQLLLNTITASSLSQATLDSYRQAASSQESSMLSALNSTQSSKQSITNAKLNFSSSDLSSKNSAASAKSAWESAQSAYDQAQLDNKKTLDSAQTDLASKKLSYENSQAQYALKVAKPRPEDLASLRAQLSQAENSYSLALENLAEAKIVSPIDGVIAKIALKVGDEAVPATAVATVITQSQVASITLNEVDAARVKTGQKAMLTFSAIDGLSISGVVGSVDTIGTVSQGVVSYGVKIVFDTQDERVKPGMSVSASVITDRKSGAVMVANSAIKSDGNSSYIEILSGADATAADTGTPITSPNLPERKTVQIGLANDTETEITQGLNDGDVVILSTVSSAAKTTTSPTNTRGGFGVFGGGSRN